MKECIEREAAIDNFMQYTWYDMDGSTIDDSDEKRSMLKSMFASIPTADVRENVRGEWVYEGKSIHCNQCGFFPHYSFCVRDGYSNDNFCPNCGADMRLSTEENNV